MSYVIITDSACDLPASVVREFGLKVIPTPVVIDGADYFDGETVKPEEFYQLLQAGRHKISTYHINPEMFREAFRPYAKAGAKVLYFCFSTGIASTFNSAHIARESLLQEYPLFELVIFDSQKASIGFGIMICRLLQMQAAGATAETVLRAAAFYRAHIRSVFTVQTLRYLIQGGRVGKASGNIGEMLNMKPILRLNQQGALEKVAVVRGRKASLQTLVQYVLADTAPLDNQLVGLCHGADPAALAILREALRSHGAHQFLEGQVGCAIGAHTGPGIIAVCYLDAPETEFEKYLPKTTVFK